MSVLFYCFFRSYCEVRHYTHEMTLTPYLAKTNQEISLLFNRTDFVKRDGSTILINKGVESGEREKSPPCPIFPWTLYPDLDLNCTQYLLSDQKQGQYSQFLRHFQRQFSKFSPLGLHYGVLVKVCVLFLSTFPVLSKSWLRPRWKRKTFPSLLILRLPQFSNIVWI